MPPPPPFPEPIKISPLIKIFRYTFLTAGIVYGFVRERKLAAIESVIKLENAKKRAQRKARLEAEKKIADERTMTALINDIFYPVDDE